MGLNPRLKNLLVFRGGDESFVLKFNYIVHSVRNSLMYGILNQFILVNSNAGFPLTLFSDNN